MILVLWNWRMVIGLWWCLVRDNYRCMVDMILMKTILVLVKWWILMKLLGSRCLGWLEWCQCRMLG